MNSDSRPSVNKYTEAARDNLLAAAGRWTPEEQRVAAELIETYSGMADSTERVIHDFVKALEAFDLREAARVVGRLPSPGQNNRITPDGCSLPG